MPETEDPLLEPEEGDVMAGDRRIARADTALPDWYVSDAVYRPIPIAWFAGALVLQVITQPVLFAVFSGFSGMITLAFAMLATALIGYWTWQRGMRDAGAGWRIATIVMLVLFAVPSVLTALSRL